MPRDAPNLDNRQASTAAPTASSATVEEHPLPHFVPGELIGTRYRFVTSIGRGGMGAVHRVDDLLLGHPVALKFLPAQVMTDPARMQMLYAEVRNARQVSHPNVCRVYDVGEVAGLHFLSMQYVEGEDLAILLRRISRLPFDKACEIAHQVCLGVAAAHSAGIVHGDLKPSNILIDESGNALVSDFGLAGKIGERREDGICGTPAYMAPELYLGSTPTTRSDIYALGLVLYEMFAGRLPFNASSFSEWRDAHFSGTVPPLRAIGIPVPQAIDATILQCVEKKPGDRPKHSLEIATVFPAPDPLKAAIACGETPSPQQVAAATSQKPLSRNAAVGLLLCSLVMLALSSALASFRTISGTAHATKSPEVLQDRAREIIASAGYDERRFDYGWGFTPNNSRIEYLRSHDPRTLFAALRQEPGSLLFWYRESILPVQSQSSGLRTVSPSDPPLGPGSALVLLDAEGHLVRYSAIASHGETPAGHTVDWRAMFAAAGADLANFGEAQPTASPLIPYDRQYSWTGNVDGIPVRVDAATRGSSIVRFHVVFPWDGHPAKSQQRFVPYIKLVLQIGTFVFGLILALRNLLVGKADIKGALRFGAFMLTINLITWAASGLRTAPVEQVWEATIAVGIGECLFFGAAGFLAYAALEPFARRQWPDLLVSWARLIQGKVHDPLVGRDLLVGAACGACAAFLAHLTCSFPSIAQPLGTYGPPFGPLVPALGKFVLLVTAVPAFTALTLLFVLVAVRALVKREMIAIGGAAVIASIAIWIGVGNVVALAAVNLTYALLVLVAMTRFGLLAAASTLAMFNAMIAFPLGINPGAWYSTRPIFVISMALVYMLLTFALARGMTLPRLARS